MKRVVQINVTANSGSTGRIAEGIGLAAIEAGWDSVVAYGRKALDSRSRLIRIGSDTSIRLHGAESRLLDNHGLSSRWATRRFLRELDSLAPDIVHLHNIHGYYLNYPLLFNWLREWGGPVVWTLHDMWPLTGHCATFDTSGCKDWLSGCKSCSRKSAYPTSLLCNRSSRNFNKKRQVFTSLDNLTLITVSEWLRSVVTQTYLSKYVIEVIYNGVDTDVFNIGEIHRVGSEKPYVLAVASVWNDDKGLKDVIALRQLLPDYLDIILVGTAKSQIAALPTGIKGIERTENLQKLVNLYQGAELVISLSYSETFGMTIAEGLACGTPAVVYGGSGMSELLSPETGRVVERGNVREAALAIMELIQAPLSRQACRLRAERLFDRRDRFREYVDLYERLTSGRKPSEL